MEILFLREYGDVYREQFAEVIHYAFRGWTKENALKFWDENTNHGELIGAVENGVLLSLLNITGYRINFYGKDVSMGGIGEVATYGTARCKGVSSQCMKKSLRIMYDKGCVISSLSPFSYEYYRKFGWEEAFESYNISISMEDLMKIPSENKDFIILKDKSQYTVLKEIYDKCTKDKNGSLIRSRERWESVFDASFEQGDKTIVVLNKSAYGVFRIEDSTMTVSEIIYEDIDSLKSLLFYFSLHSAPCKKTVIENVPDYRDVLDIIPSRRCEISLHTGMMQRVINAVEALKLYSYTAEGKFRILIKDGLLSENSGVFEVNTAGGKALSVEKTQGAYEIETDIREFSQLITGCRNADDLHRENRIKINKEEAKAFLLTRSKTAMYDGF